MCFSEDSLGEIRRQRRDHEESVIDKGKLGWVGPASALPPKGLIPLRIAWTDTARTGMSKYRTWHTQYNVVLRRGREGVYGEIPHHCQCWHAQPPAARLLHHLRSASRAHAPRRVCLANQYRHFRKTPALNDIMTDLFLELVSLREVQSCHRLFTAKIHRVWIRAGLSLAVECRTSERNFTAYGAEVAGREYHVGGLWPATKSPFMLIDDLWLY